MEYGNQIADVPIGKPFKLRRSFWNHISEYAMEVYQCENLPTLYIDSDPGVLEYLHQSKENWKDAEVRIVGPNQETMLYDIARISGRGNGTWGQAKRPYNLRLMKNVSFGPFENVQNLCLLAEYSDHSKMRNSIAYSIGLEMEIPYASGYMYADLFVNGEYLGLYGIVTKDAYKQQIQKDQILGVFELAKWLDESKVSCYTLQEKIPVRVLYGDIDSIYWKIEDFENALFHEQWDLLEELIDYTSFAKKYVLEEFVANTDMTHASQYFYIDGTGKIKCMLPWDYDWTLGNSVTYFNNKQVQELKTYKDHSYWYTRLLECEAYQETVRRTIDEYLTDQLLSDIDENLNRTREQIEASATCDQIRWDGKRAFNESPFLLERKNLKAYSREFSEFFAERRDFLRDYFSQPEGYARVEFLGELHYANMMLPKGTALAPFLQDANILSITNNEKRFLGWFTEDGLAPEDFGFVNENITFYDRYEVSSEKQVNK